MRYTNFYGKPQGNEIVWGRLIVRVVGIHKFKKVAYFDSYLDAQSVFDQWMKENDSVANKDIEKSINSYDAGLLTLAEFVHRTGKR
jgi:hypothetical protein